MKSKTVPIAALAAMTPSFLLDVGYPAPSVAPSPLRGQKREKSEFVTYK